ncbi:MAG: sugar transferase [Ardenticatenaceae bacterium]|nr:sugar transferase [Ardenticatenaceae bacterium]HBY93553.1 sugar transferase [Chloroflexota bacterium]
MGLLQLSRVLRSSRDKGTRHLRGGDTVTLPWYEHFERRRHSVHGTAFPYLKRALDLLLCMAALPFLLIAFALCAILLKLDAPGAPILTRRQRTGRGGRRFEMYAFRTTTPTTPVLNREPAPVGAVQPTGNGITTDRCLSRIGGILRRAGLDELPQVINVIKGEMSLVGPHPTAADPTASPLWQTECLDVIPGIISLWQVSGQAEPERNEQVRLDIAYIERQSLWLDISILARRALLILIGSFIL